MATVQIIRPTSFKDYVAQIEELQSMTKMPLWFRGCGNARDELLPVVYRRAHGRPVYGQHLERQIITRFRQRSMPFLDRGLGDDEWGTFFLMQHHEIPTRLLDLTENPFIALYFSVMDVKVIGTRRRARYGSDACVWALDPVKWNRQALSNQSYRGGILAPDNDEIRAYKPGGDFSGVHPVCIYGSHNSRRIVAQRGVFAVFGKGNTSMERLHGKQPFTDSCLVKVIINRRFIRRIKDSLLRSGITESTVFPDLIGLAREIRRDFGYGGL